MLKSRVFLSYTSSLGETAARVELSLKGEGFSVFRDRSALPPGESFDDRIRAAIEESDLFVFLLTPEAVAPGRYTLTELKFAEQRWPHPGGRVLPVLVEETPKEAIPAYLRAVTILKPRGNLVAEVAAEVARMGAPWWRRMLEPRRLVPAVVVALLVAGGAWLALPPYLERQEQNARAAALVKQSRSKADAGDYPDAWKILQQANEIAPASREVFEAQEQLAMNLLRHAGVNYPGGSGAFVEDLLTRTLPVLSRGTSGAKGERLANLLAHMGWADYLRERTGVGGLDPAQRYRSALEADSGNVYAHAMSGFELLRKRRTSEALAEANKHFAAALQSGREREYVRHLQVSALLRSYTNVWIDDPGRHQEAIRAASEMRIGGETLPTEGWGRGSFRAKLWSIYHFRFVAGEAQEPILAALPPAEHLATFRWLFPEEDLAPDKGGPSFFDYFTVRAQVEEHAGDRAGALASYRRVLGEFESRKLDTSRAIKTADNARAAIRRLGG